MKISITWKIHLPSSANKQESLFAAAGRKRKFRGGTLHRVANALRNQVHAPPYAVKLTRVARKKLDSDNLQSAFKNVRDGACDALGIKDDDNAPVKFEYAQEIGEPEIRVEVEC